MACRRTARAVGLVGTLSCEWASGSELAIQPLATRIANSNHRSGSFLLQELCFC